MIAGDNLPGVWSFGNRRMQSAPEFLHALGAKTTKPFEDGDITNE